MKDLNTRQKKIIARTSIGLLICLGLSISITWLVFIIIDNYDSVIEIVRSVFGWLFANFGSLIVGIIIKILVSKTINKKHLKEIELIHESYGLSKKLSKKEKPKEVSHPTNGYVI